jgi:hypothetical protein
MWFSTDDGSSLLVEDGETVTLSADDHEVTSVVLRPLTAAALQVACGILSASPARLSDTAAFETLDSTEGYIDVKNPGPDGKVGGYSPAFLRRILTILDPEAPAPTSVRLRSAQSRAAALGGQKTSATETFKLRRNIDAVQGLNDVEMPMPDIFSRFGVIVVVPKLINIVVGFNATLFLNATITQLMVNNFICYNGSRVVQQSNYLATDIFGTMIGGLNSAVHQVKGKELTIDFSQLTQQAVFI